MHDASELIRRATTIRRSRFMYYHHHEVGIFDARQTEWYILGDTPPRNPPPAIVYDVRWDRGAFNAKRLRIIDNGNAVRVWSEI